MTPEEQPAQATSTGNDVDTEATTEARKAANEALDQEERSSAPSEPAPRASAAEIPEYLSIPTFMRREQPGQEAA